MFVFVFQEHFWDTFEERVFDVLLITDEQVREYYEELSEQGNWTVGVIDEAHKIKNSDSKTYEKLLQINVKFRLLLTATPLVNGVDEIWSIIKYMFADSLAAGLFGIKFPENDPEVVAALQNVCVINEWDLRMF